MRTMMLIVGGLLPTLAFAGDEDIPEDVPRTYQKITEYDADTVDVHGQVLGPDGKITLERRAGKFEIFIKLRRDFDAEMSSSVDEVR